MAWQEYTVPETLAVLPARVFLQKQLGISLNLWRKIKHSETFRCNGNLVNPACTDLHPGDIIRFETKDNQTFLPMEMPLDIQYEDDALLIINKPAGQLVHPTTKEHEGTIANAVLYYYQKTGQPHAFHPIHRLDRQTSGLVLIAKLPQIQYQLSRGLNNQKCFQRDYLAIIPGVLSPSEGLIDAPIARKPGSMIERWVSPEGKPARTHYKTLRQGQQNSLLSLSLETGRTHQIRVHLAHLGHPLLGDDLYGGTLDRISRQALHAYRLRMTHPLTKKELCVEIPLPKDMETLLTDL